MTAVPRFVRLDGNKTDIPDSEKHFQAADRSASRQGVPDKPATPPVVSDLHAQSAHDGVFLRWVNTDREGLVVGYQVTTWRGQDKVRTEYVPAGVSAAFVSGLEAESSYRFDVAVLSSGAVGEAASTDAVSSTESPLSREEAERIALSYLHAVARVLIECPASEPAGSQAIANAVATVEAPRNALREKLAEYGLRYTAYEVGVEESVLVPSESGQKVELHLRVQETFKQEVDGGPELPGTQSILPYSFTFARADGAWVLKHVAESDGFGDGQHVVDPTGQEPSTEVGAPTPAVAGGGAADTQDVEPLAVNTALIVDYAYKWAKGRNPDYTSYGNDCTNFASQAAQAGGLGEIDGFYKSDDAWWYHGIWPIYATFTWAAAHNFWSHLWKAKRATFREYWNEAVPGDILLWDFDGNGHVDHVSVITMMVNGIPHYTQHTDDKVDRPIFEGDCPDLCVWGGDPTG